MSAPNASRAAPPATSRVPLRGLYAITSQAVCADAATLRAGAAAALRGGARLLQYRDKWSEPAQRLANALALRELCRAHDAYLIVNDDPQLAAACGADGVHLGAADAPLREARALLGAAALIGVTCSGSLARAHAAAAAGADYVAFGRFFDSRTKPEAPPAPLRLLAEAKSQLALPVCAIGGLTPHNAGAAIAAGADLVAAVDGVFGAADVEAAARAYCMLFDS